MADQDTIQDSNATSSESPPAAVRAIALELLKHGVLEAAEKPPLYRAALLHRDRIGEVLSWLDLRLQIDDIRGLAYIAVAAQPNDDEWTHPLVRRQRLTLEQSLMVAILRQQFLAHEQEAGVGAIEAKVALEELIPQLQLYFGDLGSDAQERKRLLALLEQLKGHGLVSDVDQHERVTIRPIVAHLANPENLTYLIAAMREAAGGSAPAASQGADE